MHSQLFAHFSPCAQVSAERFLRVQLMCQQDRYEFALESGHDEQATANSHNIFKRGDHQVEGFEGPH
jgi:hypothetical protein